MCFFSQKHKWENVLLEVELVAENDWLLSAQAHIKYFQGKSTDMDVQLASYQDPIQPWLITIWWEYH